MRIFLETSDVTSWMLPACLWLFRKHWPAHPPILIGGYTPPQFPLPENVSFYSIGNFTHYPLECWSDGILKFIESQSDECFIWHMSDFWLCQDVDGAMVERLYWHLLDSPHLARIDLTADRANSGNARPAGTLDYVAKTDGGRKHVGQIELCLTPPNTPYQLSFQTGLWRRAALLQYLRPGETPAEAEIRGAYRMTLANANVLGTLNDPVKYKIVQQHGRTVIDEAGYQQPPVALLPEDRAELERLGYLTPLYYGGQFTTGMVMA